MFLFKLRIDPHAASQHHVKMKIPAVYPVFYSIQFLYHTPYAAGGSQ
jgi:hypothetical protein